MRYSEIDVAIEGLNMGNETGRAESIDVLLRRQGNVGVNRTFGIASAKEQHISGTNAPIACVQGQECWLESRPVLSKSNVGRDRSAVVINFRGKPEERL